MRSVDVDRSSRSLVVGGVATLLIALWGGWAFFAEIRLHAVASHARLEVERTVHRVDAPSAGRVAKTWITVGANVEVGDPLLDLDGAIEEKRLAEEKERLRSFQPEANAIRSALAAQEQYIPDDLAATQRAIQEGRAREAEGRIGAERAEDQSRRSSVLADSGAIAEVELLRSRAEAERQRAATQALTFGLDRIRDEQRSRASLARSRAGELRRELAKVDGLRALTEKEIALLELELDRKHIRAPVKGIVGEMSPLTQGAYLKEGERIATILPGGNLKVVAEFKPEEATGRVRRGQAARLRLDGYPWTEFGTVSAEVTSVSSEPRNGTVRVELSANAESNSRISLEHGMTTVAEIEIERLSPARLLLRAVGGSFSRAD